MLFFFFRTRKSKKKVWGSRYISTLILLGKIYEDADNILGERFSDFIFNASEDVLMDTRYTQPAIFIYEVAAALGQSDFKPDCVAGHSLGEYAALVVSGTLDFEETLKFVWRRGQIFHEAFQKHPSAMGAIIGIPDDKVLSVLQTVGNEDGNSLYIANYNGPGQLVITGDKNLYKKKSMQDFLKDMGAKRAVLLPMKGVGHSPNSKEEGEILEKRNNETKF